MDGEINSLQIEDTYIKIDNHRYAVRWIGQQDETRAPVLVFLHEGLGCIKLWRDFPEQICAETGLTGIVYDRLGHGTSDPFPQRRTPHYLHDESFKYLPRFLEIINVHRPIFIGHSDGGTIALLYAAHYPDNTSGIITEAAHVFLEEVTITGIKNAVEMYESGNLKKGLKKYHGEKTDALFYGWAHTWLSPEFRNWKIIDELKNITAPSLVIQGYNDEYGTEKQVDTIVNTVRGQAEKLMIPECGHIPHFQARDLVQEKMVRFINKII